MRSENEKRAADTARSPVVSSSRPATPGEPDPNTAARPLLLVPTRRFPGIGTPHGMRVRDALASCAPGYLDALATVDLTATLARIREMGTRIYRASLQGRDVRAARAWLAELTDTYLVACAVQDQRRRERDRLAARERRADRRLESLLAAGKALADALMRAEAEGQGRGA